MHKLKVIGISLTAIFVFSLVCSVIAYFYWVEPYLPNAEKIRDVSLSEPMKIYTKEGLLISQIGVRKRYIIEYNDIPKHLKDALLVIEDNRFYDHFGVDFLGLVRAFVELVKTGQKKQGASTLTMQLARNLFLTREKSFLRKFREIFLAFRLESVYSKNDILTLYINRVFLGHRSYGFQAAAQTYFGKGLNQLSLAELALLAGLPKAPSAFNPISNPQRAQVRRDYILLRLYKDGTIDEKTYKLALSEPIKAKKHSSPVDLNAGHIASMAQLEAISILRKKGLEEDAYEKGFKVITTVSGKNQRVAYDAVQQGILDYIRRHKWSGVEKKVAIDLKNKETPWAKLALRKKNQLIKTEENLNQLVGLTQKIDYIHGLARGIIYHNKNNKVLVVLENNQIITLSNKDISWAKRTWTRETSEDNKLKLLSKAIKEDIDALIEDEYQEIYFKPYLAPAKKSLARQTRPLPVGGLIYVKENRKKNKLTHILYSKPKVQSALISIDVRTGAIISLVGGFNYQNYKFNRATQSKRQPGSNFKPFLYAAALNKGMTAATVIDDIPISFEDKSTGFIWTPNNYSGKYFGATRLRDALTHSRNLVSVKILTEIGIKHTIKYMDNFGFDKKPFQQNRNLSISLGSAQLSPLSVVRGYAVFANGGYLINPYLISEIQDGLGNTVYRYNPPIVCYQDCESNELNAESEPSTPVATVPQTLDTDISYIITDILQDVIEYGTGRRAKVLKRPDIAGKTGTTNDQYDAWFSGYNRSIATTVWVGYDTPQPMGEKETGGRAALPIWINYMREALKDTPIIELPRSRNIVEVRIPKKSSTSNTKETILEIFRSQHAPAQVIQTQTNQQEQSDTQEIQDKNTQKNLIKKLF